MFASLPPVTRAIIIANIVVFLLQQVAPNVFIGLFALWPIDGPESLFQPWQIVSYAFLHEGNLARFEIAHIFFNMFALFMFGSSVERYLGSPKFTVLYFASVVAAALTQLIVVSHGSTDGVAPTLGASGGVFGLLLAFGWLFPRTRVILLPIPIPMSAWLFVTLYGVLELVLGVTGAQAGVAHFAHLGGMLGGALSILYWRMRGRFSGY